MNITGLIECHITVVLIIIESGNKEDNMFQLEGRSVEHVNFITNRTRVDKKCFTLYVQINGTSPLTFRNLASYI